MAPPALLEPELWHMSNPLLIWGVGGIVSNGLALSRCLLVFTLG